MSIIPPQQAQQDNKKRSLKVQKNTLTNKNAHDSIAVVKVSQLL
jgi:hypothetical protein